MTSDDPRNGRLIEMARKLNTLRNEGRLRIQHGDQGFASAPSNIALLKYWGKRDADRQIPVSSSLSRTLGGFRSETRVMARSSFLPRTDAESRSWPLEHVLKLNGVSRPVPQKMQRFLELLLSDWADDIDLEVESRNNFPTGCGVASSASGYAALVGAIADMAGLQRYLSPDEMQTWLAEWARMGSGSATRSALLNETPSFPDGNSPFVAWELRGEETVTLPLPATPLFLHLVHFLVVIDEQEKSVSSSSGHRLAETSLFQTVRIAGIESKYASMKRALAEGDWKRLVLLTEEDALSMHAVMATAEEPVFYMQRQTAEVIRSLVAWRDKENLQAMWTLDAGPNVHVLASAAHAEQVLTFLSRSFPESKILSGGDHRGLQVGKSSV